MIYNTGSAMPYENNLFNTSFYFTFTSNLILIDTHNDNDTPLKPFGIL